MKLLYFFWIYVTVYTEGHDTEVFYRNTEPNINIPLCSSNDISVEFTMTTNEKTSSYYEKFEQYRQGKNIKKLFDIFTRKCNGDLECELRKILNKLNSTTTDKSLSKLFTHPEFNSSQWTKTLYFVYKKDTNEKRNCRLDSADIVNATKSYDLWRGDDNILLVEIVKCMPYNGFSTLYLIFKTDELRIDFQFTMPEDLCVKNEKDDKNVFLILIPVTILIIPIAVTLVLLRYFNIFSTKIKQIFFSARNKKGEKMLITQKTMFKNHMSRDDDSHIYNEIEISSEFGVILLEMSSPKMICPTTPNDVDKQTK